MQYLRQNWVFVLTVLLLIFLLTGRASALSLSSPPSHNFSLSFASSSNSNFPPFWDWPPHAPAANPPTWSFQTSWSGQWQGSWQQQNQSSCATPEPSAILTFGLGLGVLSRFGRRARK